MCASIMVASLTGFVGVAAAQDAAPADPPEAKPPAAESGSAGKAGDIVKLKNGGLVRGTISELIPDDAVVIVTLSGETRRFPMAEVEYAGPEKREAAPAPAAKDEPKPSAEPAATEEDEPAGVALRLESTDHEVEFFAKLDGASGYEFNSLCKAPCDTRLDPGNYTFALGEPGTKDPLEAEPVLRVTGPGTVRGKYRSRAGLRTAGGLTLFVGSIVGIVLWATATKEEEACTTATSSTPGTCVTVEITDETQLWSGRIVTVGSIITGLVLLTRGDEASVELVPGAPAALGTQSRLAAAADRGTGAPRLWSGLSVVGNF
jgi:hypothetical protein